jgi:hypothetical protein
MLLMAGDSHGKVIVKDMRDEKEKRLQVMPEGIPCHRVSAKKFQK